MKTGKLFAVFSMLGLLASCAQLGAFEVQNARTHADHDNLAKQYENTAKEMQIKAGEQRKLLQSYEDKSYLYGRQGQDFQAHTSANIRYYERASRENLKEASFHRERAAELAKREYASPAETPSQRSDRGNKAKASSGPTNSIENSGNAL